MSTVQDNGARPKAATVHDVARRAGVSAQTVSRLLKGYEGIRPATRRRVEDAIEELAYRPNQAARLLRTRKSSRIGAVVHEMFDYGPARLLSGASARAREYGYSLNIVGIDGEDEASIRTALAGFEEEQVAGVLAITLTDSVRRAVEGRPLDVPILVDPAEAHLDGPSMNEIGAALVARHLAEMGHRRVGMIMGPENWLPARQRKDGFLTAAQETGLTCVARWQGDWSAASGNRAAAAFDLNDAVTAVFAANDAMAIGLIHGLAARGITTPADVSVAGFDAIPESEYLTPSLSTVQADYEGQGRVAIDALLAQIGGTVLAPSAPEAVTLLARGSTAPPRR